MKFFYLLFLVFIPLAGCTYQYFPAPTLGGVELEGPVKEEFLYRLRSKALMGQSFKGLYRTRSTSPEGQFSQRYSVLIKRPDQLRLDILPLNGAYTLVSLSVVDGTAVFISPSERAGLVTKNFPRVIDRALGFYMQPSELIDVLMGSAGSSFHPEYFSKLKLLKDNDFIWLVDGKFSYWKFDANTKDPVYGHVRERGSDKIKYEVFYGDFVDQAGARIPQQVTLKVPQKDSEIQANLTSAGVNMEIDHQKFIVNIPPDYRIKREAE